MVVIHCPHCVNDIELEDDASGLFDCPHCDEEFPWGSDLDDEGEFYQSGVIQWWSDSSSLTKAGIILNVIGSVIYGFLAVTNGDAVGYSSIVFVPFCLIGSLLLLIPFCSEFSRACSFASFKSILFPQIARLIKTSYDIAPTSKTK